MGGPQDSQAAVLASSIQPERQPDDREEPSRSSLSVHSGLQTSPWKLKVSQCIKQPFTVCGTMGTLTSLLSGPAAESVGNALGQIISCLVTTPSQITALDLHPGS